MKMLTIKNKVRGKSHLLYIDGRIDSSTAMQFDKAVEKARAEASEIIIDCDRLIYISSAGLRVLVITEKEIKKRGGRLLLTNVSPSVREIFTVTGMNEILEIE